VLVEGTLNSDPETGGPRLYTRQDGTVGASYEIRAFIVRFLSGGNGGSYGDGGASYGAEEGAAVEEEDDIPF
jgi:single-strand DNA-binding protein